MTIRINPHGARGEMLPDGTLRIGPRWLRSDLHQARNPDTAFRTWVQEGIHGRQPFAGDTSGTAFTAMRAALEQAYGRPMLTQGRGGSIPLCNVLRETYPATEIMIMGVEEPRCLVHAPNESVDPAEIERMALAEALFMTAYAEHLADTGYAGAG